MRLRRLLQPEILIAVLAVAARIIPGPRTIDDAYITFRYAQNLIAGEGLVYNPGEAVLGTTTPVYAFLLAGMGLLTGGIRAPFRLAVTGTPMRPRSPLGRPSSSTARFQVSPPSHVEYSPDPGPPLRKNHGHRR